MDEIGRGTSTFDGLALAGAIAHHLHERNTAFTLFATHYFELTEFPAEHERAINVHVSAVESGDDIVFLHGLEAGPGEPQLRRPGRAPGRHAGDAVRQARATLEALEARRPRPTRRSTSSRCRRSRRNASAFRARRRDRAHRPRYAQPQGSARRALPTQVAARDIVMTYCVGIKLDAGLVFLSDSRTNAGLDQISTFRKMMVYERPGDRFMVMLSAGNLSISQQVREILQVEELENRDGPPITIWNATSMFDAARVLGAAVRHVYDQDGEALEKSGLDFNASMIFGGQIGDESIRLFLVYSAGNFIEATRETCYFQIGESKYGKPVLDRMMTPATPLDEAAKCALVSMDSTLKSNLSVGLPLDLLVYEADRFESAADRLHRRAQSVLPDDPQQLGREAAPGVRVDRRSAMGADGPAAAPLCVPSARYETMRKITHPGEKLV